MTCTAVLLFAVPSDSPRFRLVRRVLVALPCLWAMSATAAAAQDPFRLAAAPEVKIVTPVQDRRLDDPVVVQALVRSPAAATIVRVDAWLDDVHLGSLERPPYRWVAARPDAATTVQVRVVAIDEGGREGSDERTVSTLDAPVFTGVAEAVSLNLAVLDGSGRFLSDIEAEEVIVRDNGAPQALLRFTRADAPLRVVLLVDQSASMAEKMTRTRGAIAAFLDELGEDDNVKLIGFNHRVNTYTPFTAEHDLVAAFAQGIRAEGSTALFDALLYSLRQFGAPAPTPERRAIFLFTDGNDVDSRNPLGAVVGAVRDAGVTVFALGQGAALDDRGLREQLRSIADATGGEAAFEDDVERLPGLFADAARKLRALYFVSYRPTDPSPGWHEIEVRIQRRGVEPRHKPGYALEARRP